MKNQHPSKSQDLLNQVSENEKKSKEFYKNNSSTKISGLNKNFRYFLWTLGLLALFGVFVSASGVLTDNYLQFPTANFSSIIYLFGGANLNGSSLDNVGQINSTNMIFNNLTCEDGTCEFLSDINLQNNNLSNFYIKNSSTIRHISTQDLILSINFNNDSISGTKVFDSSSYMNDGTTSGAVTYNATGGFNGGGYLAFYGTDNKVTLPAYFKPFRNGVQTISLWVRFNTKTPTDRGYFLSHPKNTESNSVGFSQETNGNINYLMGSGTASLLIASANYDANKWYHVLAIRNADSNTTKIYWNGEKLIDTDATIVDRTANTQILLGTFTGTDRDFNGDIDNFMMWNRELSFDEVKALYEQRIEGEEPIYTRLIKTTQKTICYTGNCDYHIDGNADDEINSAIQDLCNSGGVVQLSDGTFNISNTILLNCQGVILRGSGIGSGKTDVSEDLDYRGTVLSAVTGLSGNVINVSNISVHTEYLTINGEDIANTGIGVYNGTNSFRLEYVKIMNTTSDCFFIDATGVNGGNVLNHIVVMECGRHGLNLEKSDMRIFDVYGLNNWDGSTVYMNPSPSSQITMVHDAHQQHSFHFVNTVNTQVSGAVIEGNYDHSVMFEGNVNQITFSGSTFYANNRSSGEQYEFYFNGSSGTIKDIIIQGNTFGTGAGYAPAQIISYEGGSNLDNIVFSNNVVPSNVNWGNVPDKGIKITYPFEEENIRQVSDESLLQSFNFNKINILGSAGSETLLDGSGRNNHGTNTGGTFTLTGGFNEGGYFALDGVNDYITLFPAGSSPFANNYSQTVTMWVKFNNNPTSDTDRDYFFSHFSATAGNNLAFAQEANGDLAYLAGSGTLVKFLDDSEYESNIWYMLTIIRDFENNNVKVYFNDNLEVNTTTTITNTSINVATLAGAFTSGSRNFNGSIDNIEIYNRSLSFEEVRGLYLQRAESKDSYVSQKDITVDKSGNVDIKTGNLTIGGNTVTINSLVGLTGNYTNGNCWTYYTGGIATATNCTAL